MQTSARPGRACAPQTAQSKHMHNIHNGPSLDHSGTVVLLRPAHHLANWLHIGCTGRVQTTDWAIFFTVRSRREDSENAGIRTQPAKSARHSKSGRDNDSTGHGCGACGAMVVGTVRRMHVGWEGFRLMPQLRPLLVPAIRATDPAAGGRQMSTMGGKHHGQLA